jgi:hypothetical protein
VTGTSSAEKFLLSCIQKVFGVFIQRPFPLAGYKNLKLMLL